MRHPIHVRSPVSLDHPFTLRVYWDGEGSPAATVVTHAQQAVDLFTRHANASAFRRIGASPFSPPIVRSSGLHLDVELQAFPFERQALRLLIRALQYYHCRQGSESSAEVASRSQPRGSIGAHVLSDAGELDVPVTLIATVPGETIWCGKHSSLHLSFGGVLPSTAADAFDELVACWTLLGGDGAYATLQQLESYDPDEEIDLLCDIPAVGHDFVEWQLTHLQVPDEAGTVLINLATSFPWLVPLQGLNLC